ncbi:hypothetical protein A3SI_07314 [Nitritalea halalkaliphila LW7]|uniref:Uncharacterized protein n=1 Tax=Nitritalea halalkaliphila LW7 TaxID=1189621 RepID=I5C5J7_9BACT|nr:hypothetical protein [Nitritalea halalkaliphila]EIM77099.1 hypothetical protein A3SI_07314 [Nitritalea halalkaliphila LW7]
MKSHFQLSWAIFFTIVCLYYVKLFLLTSFSFNHYDILYFRNYFFCIVGLYFYGLYKREQKRLPELEAVDAGTQSKGFRYHFKRLSNQAMPALFLLVYVLIHIFSLSEASLDIVYLAFDAGTIFIQYLSFLAILALIATHGRKDVPNLFLMTLLLVSTLNISANAMGATIYLLLNPFTGWAYSINFMDTSLWYVKLSLLLAATGFLSFRMLRKPQPAKQEVRRSYSE